MATLTMTIGLPASGKSTWAVAAVLAVPAGEMVRITKDQLRSMLHADRHHRRNERQIVTARDVLASRYLRDGINVIVDDTNLNPVHEVALRALALDCGAEFQIQDFRHVPLAECVRRDARRSNPVGARVIHSMFDQFMSTVPAPDDLQPSRASRGSAGLPATEQQPTDDTVRSTPDHYVGDASLPLAVIVDIDGTLAHMRGRSPYEWTRVGEDTPNAPVVDLVRSYARSGATIVYLSGRDASCLDLTRAWLDEHVGVPGELFMRAAGDYRKDSIVKRELFDDHLRNRYRIHVVLDDRDQVVAMWRNELGLTCFQVAPGNF